MLPQILKLVRYAGLSLCIVLSISLFAVPGLASSGSIMEVVNTGNSIVLRKYDVVSRITSDCSPVGEVIKTFKANAPLAPLNNFCFTGNSVSITDPTFQRVAVVATGSGISGAPGCNLSAQVPHYDQFSFNLTGCAAFPAHVTISNCGPAGCPATATTDTVLALYRNVPSGDSLTADGGLPAAFNPADACTNIVATNDDLSGTSVATGGSSCDQLNTADCHATCTGATLNAGMKRTLGSGRFTVVIAGSGMSTFGNYSLYMEALDAGCNISFAPSAANAGISGRVTNPEGRGIGRTAVTVSGGTLANPLTAITNPFGYYTINDLEAGQSYTVSVSAKGVIFAEPTRIVNVQDDLAGIDFISID